MRGSEGGCVLLALQARATRAQNMAVFWGEMEMNTRACRVEIKEGNGEGEGTVCDESYHVGVLVGVYLCCLSGRVRVCRDKNCHSQDSKYLIEDRDVEKRRK